MNLLEALALKFPDSSRRTLRQWIKWGRVLVDGVTILKSDVEIEPHQEVTVAEKERSVLGIPILYHDRWMVVIDKPAGLLSVPAEKDNDDALSRLKTEYRSVCAVHRIDEGTSGVLVFARGSEAEAHFDKMFEQHAIEREYLAIVEGYLQGDEGTWESYLREKENYDVEVSSEGKLAITHYKVIRRSKNFSYLRLRLETGRKHQIRVHCSEAGHPVVGDRRYGSLSKYRLCLHAHRLAFTHPFTGKQMEFTAPIPKKLQTLGLTI